MEMSEQDDKTDAKIYFQPPLYSQRYMYINDLLFSANPRIEKMADFGCSEGRFVRLVKKLPFLTQLLAVDISLVSLEECIYNARPIPYDYIFGRFVGMDVSLIRADVTVKDPRFRGLDVITCIELIEHLNAKQFEEFPDTLFGYFRPRMAIITTPNKEFNVVFPQLRGTENLRHWDHKFEMTRKEFQSWTNMICQKYNYKVRIDGVGSSPSQEFGDIGFCSQIAIFERIPDLQDLSISPRPPISDVYMSFHFPQRTGPPPAPKNIIEDWGCNEESTAESMTA